MEKIELKYFHFFSTMSDEQDDDDERRREEEKVGKSAKSQEINVSFHPQ